MLLFYAFAFILLIQIQVVISTDDRPVMQTGESAVSLNLCYCPRTVLAKVTCSWEILL